MKYILNGAALTDRETAHDEIIRALPMSQYYGRNLDALWDEVCCMDGEILLENAEFVPELLLRSEEEYRFYSELKRRTGMALEHSQAAAGFELGGIRALFDDGKIQLFREGKVICSCPIAEFSRHPGATFRMLQAHLEEPPVGK